MEGSHSGVYEEYFLVEYKAVFVKYQQRFRTNTSPPCRDRRINLSCFLFRLVTSCIFFRLCVVSLVWGSAGPSFTNYRDHWDVSRADGFVFRWPLTR
jgi:hypothetical protein